MKNDQATWISRLDFAMLCAWLILGMVLVAISYRDYGVDFRGYYAAASVLLEGGNPYDYEQVSRVLLAVTGTLGNNPFYYPPWFAWIFLPLVSMPFELARAVWMAVNFILWNLALVRLHRALGWTWKGWPLYFLYVLATFSFAWITWRYEQAGILVFAITVETILALQSRKSTRAGVWLALLLIKPNVTLLMVAGLALWLLRRRQWRPVMVAILILGALLAMSTVITPNWYEPFFRAGFGAGLTSVLDGPDRIVAYRINSTFPDWLGTFGLARQFRYALYGGFLMVGLGWFAGTVWKSDSLLRTVSVSVLTSLALTPYALQYDYPPLVIPFFWSLWALFVTATGRRTAIGLAGFVLSVIFWQQNISWAYWMVVGIVVMFFRADGVHLQAESERGEE